MNYYLITSIIIFCFALILFISHIKVVEKLKRYKILLDQKEETIKIMTQEFKDLGALNKYATERWQNTVKENKQLYEYISQLQEG